MISDKYSTEQLLNIKEVARLFRVSPRTINRWIKNEKIHIIKIGRTIRVSQEEIARLKMVVSH